MDGSQILRMITINKWLTKKYVQEIPMTLVLLLIRSETCNLLFDAILSYQSIFNDIDYKRKLNWDYDILYKIGWIFKIFYLDDIDYLFTCFFL